MTDKQILIDGIDVSGCVKLRPYSECGCQPNYGGSYGLCSEWSNCYYKQLKAKEQELTHFKKENERLLQIIVQSHVEIAQKNIDETNILLVKENMDLQHQLDQLKAENRELKAVHSCNVALSDELFKYKAENKRLKQTLTEIKSILELYANSKVGEEQPDGTYQLSSGIGGSFGFGFGVCTTTYDPRPARQALQKISEVDDENS